jgi:Arc/MetJ-type ribon-helix-helix transcriptional regulator
VSNKKSTKKMGRPKLPEGEARGKIVPVRMSNSDLELVNEIVANSDFKNASDFIRYAVQETAKREQRRTKRVPR